MSTTTTEPNCGNTSNLDTPLYLAITQDMHTPWECQVVAHCTWLNGKRLGEPVASSTYSSQQLSEMGMVGVYGREYQPYKTPFLELAKRFRQEGGHIKTVRQAREFFAAIDK